MREPGDRRQTGLNVAFAFAIALVGGVGLEAYRSLLASRQRAELVSHTQQVLEALDLAHERLLEVTERRAEELRHGFEALRVEHQGRELGPFTFSSGVACFPAHGDTLESLVASADEALYRAKRGGRNRVAVAAAPAEAVATP